tara:strand:+ start:179 stop:406 length:228 start_codon:yes stop_codon:yes gene_type:complete
MANYCHECGTATQGDAPAAVSVTKTETKVKVKRQPSAYNKAYAKQYAALKKKHPRSKFAALAKKAHVATRKVMKR